MTCLVASSHAVVYACTCRDSAAVQLLKYIPETSEVVGMYTQCTALCMYTHMYVQLMYWFMYLYTCTVCTINVLVYVCIHIHVCMYN